MNDQGLQIQGKSFTSRLFLGTGKFCSMQQMLATIKASDCSLVTVAIRRIMPDQPQLDIAAHIKSLGVDLLPNTSGARDAKEALNIALMAREILETNWLKLEIHPDPRYLLPDPIETLKAAEMLIEEGFVVLPYINADPVLCKRLEEVGIVAVMPLAAPIGSNQGLQTRSMLEIIIEQSQVPVVIDAGIGAPSHAAAAMEMGADAILSNTAIATAKDPLRMASAFKKAVECGREAWLAEVADTSVYANATSSLTGFVEA